MALNIKNAAVEQLAAEVALMAHETKTEAIRKALEDRRIKLRLHATPVTRGQRGLAYLEREVWPHLSPAEAGRTLTKQEEESLLGFGPDGV